MLGMDQRALRIAWTVFLLGLALLIVYTIRDTLLVFAGAIFFAYMLLPVVSLIERFVQKRRTLALSVVYILLVGAIIGIGFALVPALAAEATSLVTRLPKMMEAGRFATIPLPHWLDPIRAQIIETLSREAASLEAKLVPLIQQAGKSILFQSLDRFEVLRAAAFDEVGRHGERRAGKADERGLAVELLPDEPDGLEHVAEALGRFEDAQSIDVRYMDTTVSRPM